MDKIKILFIDTQLVCGGAEQALYELLTLIDRSKFDVTVMVQRDGGIWEQRFRDAGIPVINPWSCQIVSHNPFIKLRNLYKRKQIDHCMKRNGRGMLKVCTDADYQIVVAYSLWSWPWMPFLEGARTVEYVHGDANSNANFRRCFEGEKNQSRHAQYDRIICVSEQAKKSFTELTGISHNVLTLTNPINSERIRRRAQEIISLQTVQPMICAVGRLSQEKGFDRLIRIHARIVREVPHSLVIVGDGPEQDRLKTVIRELQVQDSVYLAGYQENPLPYMKHCKFLVSSSFTEGLPLVAMEALVLGKPIVSAVPSIGELFQSEKCGLITENDDDSLEAGLRRMLTDESFYAEAEAAAQRVSKEFDGKTMVQKVEKVLTDLVNESSGCDSNAGN